MCQSPDFAAVLDGATGTEHYRITLVASQSTPALGDIDGDDRADLVIVHSDVSVAAYHGRDGTQIWRTAPDIIAYRQLTALSLADLDLDGTPEIVVSTSDMLFVLDNHGETLRSKAQLGSLGLEE